MIQTIVSILQVSVVIAVPSSILLLSLQEGKPKIMELFKNPSVLLRYFVVMFIIIPGIALFLYIFDSANQQTWLALLVISLSPTTPGMMKQINKLSGDYSISIAWMIIAIFLSFVMLPLNLYFMKHLFNVSIDLGIDDVTMKLSTLFILPLIIGLLIGKFIPKIVQFLIKPVDIISKISSIVLLICVLILAVPVLINKSLLSLGLITAFLIVSLIISLLFEVPEKKYGPVLAFSVVLRLPAPALILASINNKVKIFAPDIIAFLIIGIVLMIIYGKYFYKTKTE